MRVRCLWLRFWARLSRRVARVPSAARVKKFRLFIEKFGLVKLRYGTADRAALLTSVPLGLPHPLPGAESGLFVVGVP